MQFLPIPVPADCTDGFYGAFWRRPAAYLDPTIRSGTSVFARVPGSAVRRAVDRLAADLANGSWQEGYGHLLRLQEFDLGLTLVVAELDPSNG